MPRNLKKTGKPNDALAAFMQKKDEIDAMLNRLQSLRDEHFVVAPDEVSWGNVGTLGH